MSYQQATNEWFRVYKIPAGKGENTFAFNGEAKSRDFALQIINETHEQWVQLTSGDAPAKLSLYAHFPALLILRSNTTLEGSRFRIGQDEAAAIVARCPPPAAPAPLDPSGKSLFSLSHISS